MDFTLSEEQRMFLDMFNDFAEKEVAKVAEQTDREEQPPLGLLNKAAAQGFLGAPIPEAYDGAGLDFLSYTLLLEALARHCLSTALTITMHTSLASMALLLAGSEAQKEQFLPPLVFGEALGAFMLTEPEAGSDMHALQTAARRENGHYRLNGTKTWVANGEIAGLYVVVASTGPGRAAGYPQNATAFVVEKDTPGLTVGYREPTLGLRGMTVNTVYLENCLVPAENRLGEEGSAWGMVHQVVDRLRVSLAAAALGTAEAALDLGTRFAVERRQFGVSIAEKGAIQTYLAEAAVEIEALRHLVHHAAWLCDTDQAFSREASMALYKGGQVARHTADKMLQVHGGYGFSDEYAISRIHRDARALSIIGGPAEIQRHLIVKPELARRGLDIQP